MEENISNIQNWIKTTPHMKNIRQDEPFLRMFLRGCNYKLEATKDKLDMYFTVRTLLPVWFDNWDPAQASLEAIFSAGIYLPLRGYDKKGRYVSLLRIKQVNPGTMAVDDIYKCFIMLFAMLLEGNIQAQTKGQVMILDEEGFTTSHAFMMTPSTLKKLMVVFQEAYPMDNEDLIQMSLLYFLNMPKIMKKFFSLFMSFMNDKYKQMVCTPSSAGYDDLIAELGEDVLPADYGGKNYSTAELTQFWAEEVTKQSDWLAKQAMIKTDESLRIGKSKIQSQLSCSIM
eukprot:TRINITY_DN14569_c0_g1_i1.p1 TRINITY_DN14569_c0_g1~~TRINITY_DN14569_c0_g1_i1.p1  ORF type:complete len:304 (-),score=96.45 TRINITY_DN14569_c0_g1_i1:50-904(-)